MGTEFRLVCYAEDESSASLAAQAAFARIDELEGRLSDYDPESELSRLTRDVAPGERRSVSGDLASVLLYADEVSRATEGAFDVTVGPLVRLWRRARRQGELPSAARLEEALGRVCYQHLSFEGDFVRIDQAGMRLDLGGIAKGYALDEALDVVRAHGIDRALVDGGGDVVAGDPPPFREGWRVVLDVGQGPAGTVVLAHGACATSGDAFRYVELEGVRYSHVIDPRSGKALTSRRAATVLAPTGMQADAWASALCVLEPEAGLARIESQKDFEARVWQNPGGMSCDSPGFPRRMAR